MSYYPFRTNIYISGFMGSGKSTISKLLAKKLSRPLLDTDHEIETQQKMSITKIFSKKGEAFFRLQEHLLLKKYNQRLNLVMALGGGIPLNPANRHILNQGIWINLQVPEAFIYQRVIQNKNRPILGKKIKRMDISRLLNQRRPVYNLAPIQVYCGNFSPNALVQMIVKIL